MKNHNKCALKSRLGLFSIIAFLFLTTGCKKWVEVDPPINEIIGKEIYKTDATAASVLTGIYTDMSSPGIFTGQASISLRTGLSADELTNTTEPTNILNYLYTNTLTNNGDQLFWSDLYAYIFRVNAAIEGINGSSGITETVKSQLLGEAKFLRAFMYFYLTNLYGDVPLVLSTDIKVNSSAERVPQTTVYEQIIKDLKEAQIDLSDDYVGGNAKSLSSERLRPNKSVATALLARVYLYTQKWPQAEEESTKLIAKHSVYELESLSDAFSINSREAIWQLQPIAAGENTWDAKSFVLAEGNGKPPGPDGNQYGRPVYLSKLIYNDFEKGDQRKVIWIDSVEVESIVYPYSNKYKAWMSNVDRTEFLIVFRLGEQYLIRAEARAQQNKVTGDNSAVSDLNAIRIRAGLSEASFSNSPDILKAILKERKLELFTEWGNRWLDLKRSGTIDQVMTDVAEKKGTTWVPYKSLYPIPVSDIQRNPSLRGHQNPGYPEI